MGKNLFEVLKERKQIIKVSVVVLLGVTAMYTAPACFATKHTNSAVDQKKVSADVATTDSAGRVSSTHELPVAQAESSSVVASAASNRATLANLANSDLRLEATDDISAVSYDEAERVLRINKSGRYTISCVKDQTDNRIEVTADEGKVHLTLNGVRILTDRLNAAALNIVGGCDVDIEVIGKNKLDSGENCAGLQKNGAGILTLHGSGQLVAFGGRFGAGIGGSNGKNGENIVIKDATVAAVGGHSAAGIGGGNGGSGRRIIIESGKLLAQGGCLAAGIGGGYKGSGEEIEVLQQEKVKAIGGCTQYTAGEYMPSIGGGYFVRAIDQLNSYDIIREYMRPEKIDDSKSDGTLVCKTVDYDFSMPMWEEAFYTKVLSGLEVQVEMRPFEGKVFSHIPHACDVYQRVTGNCVFASVLMSFAKNDPQSIIGAIRDNKNGTVTVRLYDYGRSRRPFYYRFRKTIPIVYTQESCKWAALFEKAYVLHIARGFCEIKCPGKDVMSVLRNSRILYQQSAQKFEVAFRSLTDRSLGQVFYDGLSDMNNGCFCFLPSKDKVAPDGLLEAHCYTILGSGRIQEINRNYFVVRNPNGFLVPLYDKDEGGNIVLSSSLTRKDRNGVFVVLISELDKYFDEPIIVRYK